MDIKELSYDEQLEQIKTKRAHINDVNKKNYYKRKEEGRNKIIIPKAEHKQRGRPKKVINNDLNEPVEIIDNSNVKPRGRKKKEITPEDVAKLINIQDAKQPKGRPKKQLIVIDKDIKRLQEKFNIIDSNDNYKIE